MRVDGKFLAVNGKSNFDGTFTAVTQHDGKLLAVDGFPFYERNFLAVEGNSNFDRKSPLYRDRPPVRYFYVGKFTEHRPRLQRSCLCSIVTAELVSLLDEESARTLGVLDVDQ